ncbi:beach-domain-containing protein [Ceraceosorus guamensis]|uniref:Beach-domain-containing protein n=1 Tax=Ceraceosorus guamensis TaxID=1522189 RepID=A0A316VR53_9BASI|nr:beach-domain-containing protein [Ceraceosorus guamensis]PWN39528.1 beach-domain-containing protein [Ceraceosorus guamensis]
MSGLSSDVKLPAGVDDTGNDAEAEGNTSASQSGLVHPASLDALAPSGSGSKNALGVLSSSPHNLSPRTERLQLASDSIKSKSSTDHLSQSPSSTSPAYLSPGPRVPRLAHSSSLASIRTDNSEPLYAGVDRVARRQVSGGSVTSSGGPTESPLMPRSRDSSAVWEEQRDENLRELDAVLASLQQSDSLDLDSKLHLLSQLQRLIHEGTELPLTPRAAKGATTTSDAFRKSGGYLCLLGQLTALESTRTSSERTAAAPSAEDQHGETSDLAQSRRESTQDQMALQERLRIEIFKLVLSLLAANLLSSTASLAHFEKDVGWDTLLASLRLCTIDATSPAAFFGALLGLAVGDVGGWIGWLERLCAESNDSARVSAYLEGLPRGDSGADDKEQYIPKRVSESWHSTAVEIPKAIGLVLTLLDEANERHRDSTLRFAICAVVERLSISSRRNQVMLAQSGLTSHLIQSLLKRLPDARRHGSDACLARSMSRLLGLGLESDAARVIFKRLLEPEEERASHNDSLMELLVSVAESSRVPNNITFDCSIAGHASLAFSSLRRPFPPGSASRGFSFFTSIYIERIEPSAELELFQLFDGPRNCVVRLTIEPGTGQVHYCTEAGESASRTHFVGGVIPQGQWTHVCLVHARPKGTAKRSVAQLSINGILVDEQMVPWPASATGNVRAVIGTAPQRNAGSSMSPGPSPISGGGFRRKQTSRLIWSLGVTYFMDALVPRDLPLVLSELSRTYSGNLQDSLGKFLTYQTSTRVNLRLNAVSKSIAGAHGSGPAASVATERDLSKHPLVTAIAGNARDLFSEERFYFIVSSANTWALARQSTAGLDAAQRPGPVVVLNQALPLTRDAIASSYGYAKLYGHPTLSCPIPLDETVWQLGGVSLLLAMVERASMAGSREQLEVALRLFFDLVDNSWRLSEDAEKKKAYEVLSLLLHAYRKQSGSLSMSLLSIFERAVGIHEDRAEDAALSNPFVYRLFMLDFELWSGDDQVQQAHLAHFAVLLRTSAHRRFNIKRVAKMQIVRKLLYALRADHISATSLSAAMEALRAALLANFSDASIRAITTYLGSQLCRGLERTSKRGSARGRAPTVDSFPPSDSATFGFLGCRRTTLDDSSATPLMVFELLTDVVLQRPSFLAKMATSVSNKWLLLFFHPKAERRAAVLSLSILEKLFASQPSYKERFNATGGIKTMERLLPRFWASPTVLPTCFAMLFGRTVDAAGGEEADFVERFGPLFCPNICCPPMLRAIVAALRFGLREVASKSSDQRRSNLLTRSGTMSRPRQSANNASLSPAIAAGGAGGGGHARKRSTSMNLDSQGLAEAFRISSELSLLEGAVALLERHCRASAEFRDLVYSPIILRLLVDVISPHIDIRTLDDWRTQQRLALGNAQRSSIHEASQPSVLAEALCNRILATLVDLALDSMIHSGTVAIVAALTAAAPPADLVEASALRAAIYYKLCDSVVATIAERPSLISSSRACVAFASLAEAASDEALHGSTDLAQKSFDLVTTLLSKSHLKVNENFARDATFALASQSLVTSLNRIVLYRFAAAQDDESRAALLRRVLEHQTSVLLEINTDAAFLRCLVNQAFKCIKTESKDTRAAGVSLLKLMVISRPALIEQIISDGVSTTDLLQQEDGPAILSRLKGMDSDPPQWPFQTEWLGFLKSLETLKAAAHLERVAHVKELLDRSDARDQSVVATERRMIAWQANLRQEDNLRYTKYRHDVRELFVFAQAEWKKLMAQLQRERGVLGSDADGSRLWCLDPTEGPTRVRSKLQELPPALEEVVDVPYLKEQTAEEEIGEIEQQPAWSNGEVDAGDTSLWSDEPVSEQRPPPSSQARDLHGKTDAAGAEKFDVGGDGQGLVREENVAELGDGEEKFRRVLRSLERGDVIMDVFNTSRVVGIECRAALLIVGRTAVYIVDDYCQLASGELCASWEVPPEQRDALVMATVAQSDADHPSNLIAQLDGEAQTRKWSWDQLSACHRRAFLHRRTAVELFFADGQSCLLVLDKTATVQRLLIELAKRNRVAVAATEHLLDGIREGSATTHRSGGSGGLSSRLAGVLGRGAQPGLLTAAWMRREVSNFEYLMQLNTLAGRTYTDLSAYPVFPWILADYSSMTLNLDDPASFRRLELPMGAQTPARRRQYDERYAQLLELGEPPRHYGTHYSTAATVCGYLIRVRPFSTLLISLQGGSFDLADRTFSSIKRAWDSASELTSGDVRELVPELFFFPQCLLNTNRFDFGLKQDGETVDDVELPPWARGDPQLFVQLHREALESDYVSANIHLWIDLIFGWRSRGEAAVESTNVFHPLSYDDGVDLEAIESPHERLAAAQSIHNFGQSMRQLFHNPHPQRYVAPLGRGPQGQRLGLDETPWLFVQSIVPIRSLKGSIHFIYAERVERAYASPRDYLILPKLGLSVSSGHLDGSLRLFSSNDPTRSEGVTEHMVPGRITCFAPAGPANLLAGSNDGLVTSWKVDSKRHELSHVATLRAHTAPVITITACTTYSIAVSGSEDLTAVVWDLNRGDYVRSLRGHELPVHLTAIDEKSGLIATAAGTEVRLWNINGDLVSRVTTNASVSDPVTSLAFFERQCHDQKLALLLTGHRGKVVSWVCIPRATDGSMSRQIRPAVSSSNLRSAKPLLWRMEAHHVFEHRDRIGPLTMPLITAIKVVESFVKGGSGQASQRRQQILMGDEHGRLYIWALPGDATPIPDGFATHCMWEACSKKFGVLEAKRTCSACGGLFCSNCATPYPAWNNARFCESCKMLLSLLPDPPAPVSPQSARTRPLER